MQASDGLFHLQAGMQTQVLGKDIRSMYGLILRFTAGCGYEQAIFVYTRRAKP